jgi:hypothetical protein
MTGQLAEEPPFSVAVEDHAKDVHGGSVLVPPRIRVHRGHLPQGLPSPDVYFLPTYGRAAGAADGGEWILLEAFDGAWQVPLIVRTLSADTKDAISPTYSGSGLSISLPPEVGSSRAVARSAVSRFVRGAEGVVPRR